MARKPSDFLNVTTPENEIESPRSSAVSARSRERGEAMEQGAEPPLPHFLRQDRGHVVVGVARMDDKGQVELAGKRDLSAKNALGDVARRAVIVIIEARLADADAFGMFGESAHGVEILRPLPGRLMGMRADGEKHVVIPLRDRDHACGLRHFRADGDHPLDAGRPRALDDPDRGRRRNRENRGGNGCR